MAGKPSFIQRFFDSYKDIIETASKIPKVENIEDALQSSGSVAGLAVKLFINPWLAKLKDPSDQNFWKTLQNIMEQSITSLGDEQIELVYPDFGKLSDQPFTRDETFSDPIVYGPVRWVKQRMIELCANIGSDKLDEICRAYDNLTRETFTTGEWAKYFGKRNKDINEENKLKYLLHLMNTMDMPMSPEMPIFRDIYVPAYSWLLPHDQWGKFETKGIAKQESTADFITTKFFDLTKDRRKGGLWHSKENRCPILYISANFGVGKTTFLKHLAASLAEKKYKSRGEMDYFPVFTGLQKIKDADDVEAHMREVYEVRLDTKESYIFLLDSIDESGAPSDDHLRIMIQGFESLAKKYENSVIVTTSRPLGGPTSNLATDIKGKNGEFLFLEGFDKRQVDEYINSHRKVTGAIPAELNYSLLKKNLLKKEEDISKPLFISMVIHIFKEGNLSLEDIKARRGAISKAELYMRYLNTLSDKLKRPGEDEGDLKPKHRYISRKIAAMRQLMDMRDGDGVEGVKLKEFEAALGKRDKEIYKKVSEEHYLLLSHFGKNGDHIEFIHKSFREYLVAEYLLEVFIRGEEKVELCLGYFNKEVYEFFKGLVTLFLKALRGEKKYRELFEQYFESICAGWSGSKQCLCKDRKPVDNCKNSYNTVINKALRWLKDDTVYVIKEENKKQVLNIKYEVKKRYPSQEHIYCERWICLLLLKTIAEADKSIVKKIRKINLVSLVKETLNTTGWWQLLVMREDNQLGGNGMALLTNINLSGSKLSGAKLSNANLSGSDLSHTKFSHAVLSYADCSGSNFSNADLSGSDLSCSDISKANLSSADLSAANLYYAELYNTDLFYADLSGADLSFANLSNADLSFANLSVADLSGADLSDAKGLTIDQLKSTKLSKTTKLPDKFKHLLDEL